MNVPIDQQIWTAEQVADYFGITTPYFLRVVCFREGFPPRIAHLKSPRWAARAVIDWALA